MDADTQNSSLRGSSLVYAPEGNETVGIARVEICRRGREGTAYSVTIKTIYTPPFGVPLAHAFLEDPTALGGRRDLDMRSEFKFLKLETPLGDAIKIALSAQAQLQADGWEPLAQESPRPPSEIDAAAVKHGIFLSSFSPAVRA